LDVLVGPRDRSPLRPREVLVALVHTLVLSNETTEVIEQQLPHCSRPQKLIQDLGLNQLIKGDY